MSDRKVWGCFECGAQLSPGPGDFYVCITPHCKRWAVKMRLPSDGTPPDAGTDGWEIRKRRDPDSIRENAYRNPRDRLREAHESEVADLHAQLADAQARIDELEAETGGAGAAEWKAMWERDTAKLKAALWDATTRNEPETR